MKPKMTICSALELIAQETKDSKFSKECMKSIAGAARFLKRKMDLTVMQCYVLSVVLENTRETVSCQDLAEHASVSPLRIMSFHEQIDSMVERGFIYKAESRVSPKWNLSYAATPELINAVHYNHGLEPIDYSYLTFEELLKTMDGLLSECDYGSISYTDMLTELKKVFSACGHIDFCQKVNALNLSDENFVLLLILCNCLATKAETFICSSDYDDIIPSGYYHRIARQFKDGTSELIAKNLVVCTNDSCGWFSLTDDCVLDLLGKGFLKEEKMVEATATSEPEVKIKPKQMFYNPEEAAKIDRLANLLERENFAKIQERMRKANMRPGFCTLFHGAPGTGKTETVLQLARATGREIVQVDMSNIKDKYVGESEKNIQAVFSDYNTKIETSDVAPILLFNEADAIFGKRHTDINSEVEQMSNAIQNIILQSMETFEGIMIATTNLTDNLDAAFERRFLYKIEFHKPAADIRKKIWLSMMPEIGEKNASALSKRYDFSGGQIENVARRLMVDAILYGNKISGQEIVSACEEERFCKKTHK